MKKKKKKEKERKEKGQQRIFPIMSTMMKASVSK